jgi:hypothetical protein
MKNEKLAGIIAKAGDDLKAYAEEHEDKILEAWYAAEEEAADNETKPKFKLGFGIVLDLDKNTMETVLTWAVRHKASSTCQIPDTNQPGLPLEDTSTVTISQEGHEDVTMTHKQLSEAAKKLSKK